MKNTNTLSTLYLFICLALLSCTGKKDTPTSTAKDPLQTRVYTLQNGLKVFMSVNKEEPRIQTYIAVKAGSKNDPADATGLAHYLEHMLFKGTDKFGTQDFAKEAELIDKIEELYETYRATTDEQERKKLYRIIDSVSYLASQYAIANEYDKMVGAIGSKGTNAYTSVEQTVYINNIPSNQLEKWLTLEAERFRFPVLRLFHTELEAVYEEKNISLDEDSYQAYEALLAGLFQKHSYGTQTTIGTVEHLKNPSLKKIREYYNTYYVPNNMAICMSGDFNPDEAIEMIEKHFGSFKKGDVPVFEVPEESPIKAPVVKEITGPDAEFVMIGFRLPGSASRDALIARVVSSLLYNQTAGLIDLNLIQEQKVLGAAAYDQIMKDYSMLMLEGENKENQTLEEVAELLLKQTENLKNGNFPDWLPQAVAKDYKLAQIKQLQSNSSRAHLLVEAFIHDIPVHEYLQQPELMESVSKEEIIAFAKKYLNDNYVVVYKREGEPGFVQKVVKPEITEIAVNREAESDFQKNLLAIKTPDIEPVFVDYKKDLQHTTLACQAPLVSTPNKESQLFNLLYVTEMGSNHDKLLPLAAEYLNFLETDKYTSTALKQELFKLGCSFTVSSSEERTYITLSGLQESFEPALELFEHLLANAKPNEEALQNLLSDELKNRSDAKKNKGAILWGGLYNYAKYGPKSYFNQVLSNEALMQVTSAQLLAIIHSLTGYQHTIMYYGPERPEHIASLLNTYHKPPQPLKDLLPEPVYPVQNITGTQVFMAEYDMKQAEILFYTNAGPFDVSLLPIASLYNEYFGGGMSSIVFQEIREARALAYSVFSTYSIADRKDKRNSNYAYIGTQADKLPDAMLNMYKLMKELPHSERNFELSKEAALQKIRTSRLTRTGLLFDYLNNQKKGIDYDVRKDIFEKIQTFTFDDMKSFHAQHIRNANYHIMVLGKKTELDMNTLKKYGKIQSLSLEEIFGY